MNNIEINEWLKGQNYQTEYEETGEYRMYFAADMPKILEEYYKWKVEKLNIPDVMESVCHCINWHPSTNINEGKKAVCSHCKRPRQTVT